MFKKLDIGWWAAIAVCLFLEVAALYTLDYQRDPVSSIIIIHAFPAVLIGVILKWGPDKEK